MKRFLFLVYAFGVSSGCVVASEGEGSQSAPVAQALNGAPGRGLAFTRWYDGFTATGNANNTTMPFSTLWTGNATYSSFAFFTARGPSIGAGLGSYLAYQYDGPTNFWTVRPKQVAAGGLLIEPNTNLAAFQGGTHFTATSSGNSYFFYNRNNGSAGIYYYTYNSSSGNYSAVASTKQWPAGSYSTWDVATAGVGPDGVLLYNTTNGAVALGHTDPAFPPPMFYQFASPPPVKDPAGNPYTHVDYVPGLGHVFYSSTDPTATQLAVIQYDVLHPLTPTVLPSAPSPGTGYTQMVATNGSKVFFYKSGTGTGALVDLSTNTVSPPQSGYSTDWTTITRVE